MSFLKDKKLKIIIFVLVIAGASAYLLFNEYGLLKYIKLKQQVNSLHEQISNVQKENNQLENSIDSLQRKIPAKIEKTAREKYHMVREGETVIEIKEK